MSKPKIIEIEPQSLAPNDIVLPPTNKIRVQLDNRSSNNAQTKIFGKIIHDFSSPLEEISVSELAIGTQIYTAEQNHESIIIDTRVLIIGQKVKNYLTEVFQIFRSGSDRSLMIMEFYLDNETRIVSNVLRRALYPHSSSPRALYLYCHEDRNSYAIDPDINLLAVSPYQPPV